MEFGEGDCEGGYEDVAGPQNQVNGTYLRNDLEPIWCGGFRCYFSAGCLRLFLEILISFGLNNLSIDHFQ